MKRNDDQQDCLSKSTLEHVKSNYDALLLPEQVIYTTSNRDKTDAQQPSSTAHTPDSKGEKP